VCAPNFSSFFLIHPFACALRFIQTLRPERTIPTVNVGSAKSRRQMAICIQRWLKSAPKQQSSKRAKREAPSADGAGTGEADQ
jgi:hypothetical protein